MFDLCIEMHESALSVTDFAGVEVAVLLLLLLLALLAHRLDDLVGVSHGEGARVAAAIRADGGRIERELRPETRAALRVARVVRPPRDLLRHRGSPSFPMPLRA